MTEEKTRRIEDKGVVAVATRAARETSRTFWDWIEYHRVDSLSVIIVSLWLTIRVVEWAMNYADEHYEVEGLQIAAIIGAVLTPWGIMQAALFKFYADLKAKDRRVEEQPVSPVPSKPK